MRTTSQNIYEKADRFFSRQGVDSEKPLLTSRGRIYSSKSISGRFLRLLRIAKPVELDTFKAILAQRIPGLDTSTAAGRVGGEHLTRRSFRQLQQRVSQHNSAEQMKCEYALDRMKSGLTQVDHVIGTYYAEGQVDEAENLRCRRELADLAVKCDRYFASMVASRDAIYGKVDEQQFKVPGKELLKLAAVQQLARRILGPDSPAKPRAYGRELLEKGFKLDNADAFEPHRLDAEADRLDAMYRKSSAEYMKNMADIKANVKEREQAEARAEARAKAKARAWGGARARGAQPAPMNTFEGHLERTLETLGLDPQKRLGYTMKEIRAAYKKMSLKHHPDKVMKQAGGASVSEATLREMELAAKEKFQEIGKAYEWLSAIAYLFKSSESPDKLLGDYWHT